jgi:hypothetical protein
MLTSIQTGTFLESLSQIVGKTSIGAVEMDLSIEEIRSVEEATTIMQGTRISETGDDSEGITLRESRKLAGNLTIGGKRSASNREQSTTDLLRADR